MTSASGDPAAVSPSLKLPAPSATARTFWIIAAVITLARIIALFLSDLDLGPDETQYWFWAQSPSFGYFSKPPMIAWIIGATTSVFGDAEWAVRLSAPFLHLGTAYILFRFGKRFYNDQVGLWAGVIWLTLPGVSLSSMLISTDALMLFFWSAALFAFFHLLAPEIERTSPFPALLGLALGLGLLSKYALIYFAPGAAVALLFAAGRRRWKDLALACLIAAAVAAPNMIWNAQNGFQTVSHTAANANWEGPLFHPIALAEFIIAQFGVFGPVTFALLLAGLATVGPRLAAAHDDKWVDIALIGFVVPPLAIICIQAFISRAHANWGAAAFPAAAILIAAWAHRAGVNRILKGGVILNAAAAVALTVAVTNFSIVDQLGLSDIVKRLRGWEGQGADIVRLSADYDAVMTDDREVMGGILYYARASDTRVVAWNSNHRIDDHYEAFEPFTAGRDQKILYVTPHADAIGVKYRFEVIKHLGETTADLEDGRYRRLYLFELSGYRTVSGNLLEEADPL